MGAIEDLVNEIGAYAREKVELTIVNWNQSGHLNPGEVVNFMVRVKNNGQLNLKNLQFHIEGSQWSSVGFNSYFGFDSYIVTDPKDIDAHGQRDIGPFYMNADKATGNQGTNDEDIVKVHISKYDVDLKHILVNHTGHEGSVNAKKSIHVHP